MRTHWMELRPCANPKCRRLFPVSILSARECCDDECDRQRRAIAAKAERVGLPLSPAFAAIASVP